MMKSPLDKFFDISEQDREEERLYSNERLAKYFEDIVRRLVDANPNLKAISERHPISWSISEMPDKINAAFCPSTTGPAFFEITRGLLSLLESEDQLAFVMGHELEHYFQTMVAEESGNIHTNSHVEEGVADWNSIQRLADGGYQIDAGLQVINTLEKRLAEAKAAKDRNLWDELDRYLRSLDPHPQDNTRDTINEVATQKANKKLAQGINGKKGVNANAIKVTPLCPEISRSEYISYVDKKFQDAHFDDMSMEEKQEFLIDMLFDVSRSHSQVREVDFKKHVGAYLQKLEEEMSKWTYEEKEKRFRDGTAPAMRLIERFIDRAVLNLDKDQYQSEDIQELESLYLNSLAKVFRLWPSSVYFEGNSEFWQQLRQKISDCLERGQKRAASWSKMTEEEKKQAKKQDNEDCSFVNRLNSLFVDARGWHKIRMWRDLPLWTKVQEGWRRPDLWANIGEFAAFSESPIQFLPYHRSERFGVERVHKIISDKYYDEFIVNADGSIGASKVLQQKPRKVSDLVDKVWNNAREYDKWQNQILKEELHKKIADHLHDLKRRADRYIAGEDKEADKAKEAGEGEMFGEFEELAEALFPGFPEDEHETAFNNLRLLELQDVSDIYPGWQYVPRIWLSNFSHTLGPIALDRDLLKSYMTKEDVEFFTHPQKEYADKLVDAIIDRFALRQNNEKSKYRRAEDYYPFPNLTGRGGYRGSIACNILPYQQERILEAYTQRVPALRANVEFALHSRNSDWMRYVYQNLFEFYCLKTNPKRPEDVTDFSNFHSPLPQYVLKCFNLPPFLLENAASWEDFLEKCPAQFDNKKKKDIPEVIRLAIFDSMLHYHGEDVSLKLINDIMFKNNASYSATYERRFLHPKLVMICQNPNNWPKSLVEFSDLVHGLHREQQIGQYGDGAQEIYAVVKNGFVDLLQKEKDPKKIEQAWILAGDYLSLETSDSKDYDRNMVPLLANSPMWKDKDIQSKIGLFKKIKEYMWGSDCTIRDNFAAGMLDEIEKIKDPQERESLLFGFIQKDGRLENSELLDRVHHMWVKSVADIMGKIDDESDEYLAKIQPYIDKIKKDVKSCDTEEEKASVLELDKRHILEYLAEEVVSQKRLSAVIKPKPFSLEEKSNWEKTKGCIAIIGSGIVETYLRGHPERRGALLDFLRSKGSPEDCNKLRLALVPDIDDPKSKKANLLKYEMSVSRIQRQYRAFWSSTPEVQTLIVDAILKDTSKTSASKEPFWKQNFDYVAEQIFPGKTPQSEALTSALYAYIESRPKRDQNLLLARMLIASGVKSDNMTEEQANQKLGKGIKVFLESIGPAGIKLGQALHAVPSIPSYIRDNLKDFTSNVSRPTRWEIYDWLNEYKEQNPEEKELIDGFKLGKILGSASFFVTMDAGKGEVVKLLRLGAKVEAIQELGYISQTLEKLSKNKKKILGDLGPTLQRIVKQAEESVDVETDLDQGEKQFQIAKNLYPESVTARGICFNVKEAEWKEPHGCNWAELEKMPGVEIEKIEDPEYRKAASIAYVATELLNIFSGGKFDFDRHTGQMKIDRQTNTLGLFDTGSMLLEDPSVADQQALGQILYRTMENVLSGSKAKTFAATFAAALTEEIDRFYKKSSQPSSYITQVQRGLLALSGYYKDFSATDFAECLDIAFNNPSVKVSDHIMSSFVSEMLRSTGLFKTKTSQEVTPEEVAIQKEKLGRLIFNLYAAAQKSGASMSISDLLMAEYERAKESETLPALGKIFANNLFKDVKIPACFGTHIVAALREQQIDPIIVKGAMKEAFSSLCLQDKDKQDSPQIKRELGKQLYEFFCLARKKGQSFDKMKPEIQDGLTKLSDKSVMARNLSAILALSKYMPAGEKIDLKEIVWEIMSQKDLDQDVLKGIQTSMKGNGQTFAALALNFRRPLSKIRKIRRVFSLFKKNPTGTDQQKLGLRELLSRAQDKIKDLPQDVTIEHTEKGSVLRFLKEWSKNTAVPLAKPNPSIQYGKRGDLKNNKR